MASQPSLPIQVNPSSVQAMILAGLRIITILCAGSATVLHLVAKGDLTGLYAFFAANDGFAFITAAITLGMFVTSLIVTLRKHQKLVIVSSVAPNTVAQVTK